VPGQTISLDQLLYGGAMFAFDHRKCPEHFTHPSPPICSGDFGLLFRL
jgi:hypothetical protein